MCARRLLQERAHAEPGGTSGEQKVGATELWRKPAGYTLMLASVHQCHLDTLSARTNSANWGHILQASKTARGSAQTCAIRQVDGGMAIIMKGANGQLTMLPQWS